MKARTIPVDSLRRDYFGSSLFGSSLFLQCFFLFKFPISVTPSGMVRARLSSKPLFSVSEREPLPRKSSPAGPRSGKVRARLPPKPLFSVSEREPPPRKSSPAGPRSGKVRARCPGKPNKKIIRPSSISGSGDRRAMLPYTYRRKEKSHGILC